MRATLMSASYRPVAGNRLVPVQAQPPVNLFGLGQEPAKPLWMKALYSAFSVGVGGALIYHGYKRNDSLPWAIAWGVIGGAFWPIAAPVALAQGFAQPKKEG